MKKDAHRRLEELELLTIKHIKLEEKRRRDANDTLIRIHTILKNIHSALDRANAEFAKDLKET